MSYRTRLRLTSAALGTAVLTLAACSAGSTPTVPAGTPPPSSATPTAPTPPPLAGCTPANAVASYAPSGALPSSTALPAGSWMAQIKKRGRLIAAVSADNLRFGFRNPLNNQLEGFDIDMIRAVARAIFGNVKDIDSKIEFRVVNFAQRIPQLLAKDNPADIVADVMTINCSRWAQIAFSSEYFDASQQVLVANDSTAKTMDDLAGHKVCAADGSSGQETLTTKYKQVKAVSVSDISQCMVLFQQGSVDGIISDNTVLAGFASQDPYAKVLAQRLDKEPYGMGIANDHRDFVRFVNQVLAQLRSNGQWLALYDKWVAPTLGKVVGPPPAVYGR